MNKVKSPVNLVSIATIAMMTAILSVNATAEEKKGTAEKIGEKVGPYVAGATAGAATALLPIQTRTVSVIVSSGAGALGVHAVGDVGKVVGGGYGKYVDATGNNVLFPSMNNNHSPSKVGGAGGAGGGGGCAGKSIGKCILDTIGRTMKSK